MLIDIKSTRCLQICVALLKLYPTLAMPYDTGIFSKKVTRKLRSLYLLQASEFFTIRNFQEVCVSEGKQKVGLQISLRCYAS